MNVTAAAVLCVVAALMFIGAALLETRQGLLMSLGLAFFAIAHIV